MLVEEKNIDLDPDPNPNTLIISDPRIKNPEAEYPANLYSKIQRDQLAFFQNYMDPCIPYSVQLPSLTNRV